MSTGRNERLKAGGESNEFTPRCAPLAPSPSEDEALGAVAEDPPAAQSSDDPVMAGRIAMRITQANAARMEGRFRRSSGATDGARRWKRRVRNPSITDGWVFEECRDDN